MTSVFVLYPTGTKFNMDYYVKTRVPMVKSKGLALPYAVLSLIPPKVWKKYELISWEVVSFGAGDS